MIILAIGFVGNSDAELFATPRLVLMLALPPWIRAQRTDNGVQLCLEEVPAAIVLSHERSTCDDLCLSVAPLGHWTCQGAQDFQLLQ